MITIKAFFYIDELDPKKVLKDIYMDLLVDEIGADAVKATILTPLPTRFPLSRGDVLEVMQDEILYNVKGMGALKGKVDKSVLQ